MSDLGCAFHASPWCTCIVPWTECNIVCRLIACSWCAYAEDSSSLLNKFYALKGSIVCVISFHKLVTFVSTGKRRTLSQQRILHQTGARDSDKVPTTTESASLAFSFSAVRWLCRKTLWNVRMCAKSYYRYGWQCILGPACCHLSFFFGAINWDYIHELCDSKSHLAANSDSWHGLD